MRGTDPQSWLDRAVHTCFALLIAAVAVYIAVRLIEAIFPVLALLVLGGLLISGVVWWFRAHLNGW
jgi:hypothetical protein